MSISPPALEGEGHLWRAAAGSDLWEKTEKAGGGDLGMVGVFLPSVGKCSALPG